MYNSASEVIREGLRALEEKEQAQQREKALQAVLLERLSQISDGVRGTPLEEAGEEIIQQMKDRAKNQDV